MRIRASRTMRRPRRRHSSPPGRWRPLGRPPFCALLYAAKDFLKYSNCSITNTAPMNQAEIDAKFLHPDVPLSKTICHTRWVSHLVDLFNKPGMRVLEIGSREVTGKSNVRERFANARYVGFDLYAGRNVDVVGDAHKLSSYFAGEKFDLIYSSAVL